MFFSHPRAFLTVAVLSFDFSPAAAFATLGWRVDGQAVPGRGGPPPAGPWAALCQALLQPQPMVTVVVSWMVLRPAGRGAGGRRPPSLPRGSSWRPSPCTCWSGRQAALGQGHHAGPAHGPSLGGRFPGDRAGLLHHHRLDRLGGVDGPRPEGADAPLEHRPEDRRARATSWLP